MLVQDNSNSLDAAAAWIARLCSDEATAVDRQAFCGWFGASTDHVEAFDRMLDLWEQLSILRSLPVDIGWHSKDERPAS